MPILLSTNAYLLVFLKLLLWSQLDPSILPVRSLSGRFCGLSDFKLGEEKEGRFKLRNAHLSLLLYGAAKYIACPSGEKMIVSRKTIDKPKEHFT